MIKVSSFLFFLLLLSCQNPDNLNISYLHKEDLLSVADTTYVCEEENLISNFITKTVLKESSLYIKELNNDQVDAYKVLDSTYNSYKYEKRPIKVNDFAISNENIFLLSSLSNKITRFNKPGNHIDEIELKPEDYEVEHFMGKHYFITMPKSRFSILVLNQRINIKMELKL